MNKKTGKILSITLPLLLGVFLIIYSYNQFTPEQRTTMMQYFADADYRYIAASLVIALTSHMSRAYRWRYTLRHLGYESSFFTNLFAVGVGYFLNLTIPRSGEVSRALVLKKYSNVPFDKGFGTIISERFVDLIFLLICIGGTLLLQFDVLKGYLSEKIPIEKLLLYGSIIAVVFIAVVLFYRYSKLQWVLKLKVKISGLIEGALSVFKMPNKWPFLFHSLYIWVAYIAMFYITIHALPGTTGISFGAVATAFVIGSLTITFTNGGFGVYPVVLAAILVLYNVPLEVGTAFGWIVWTSQIIFVILFGGISFLLLPLLNRKK
ncbi:lysylphosphatidylglycerol synthase transmembrane domain-containing protein [uncultured Flavobacterium sp.]|uniref:lysylphosphatidylglycerol synthase transmembrane domain-containing protein n=1 Tax=uncultured Flavobacterium sp. TaxID=165435 RepID=UPI0025D0A9CB|nr:lysylphosphatidylglycerol synthase transmembrane domain-containing protein [uncultured Flavobacterium sp.]